MEEVLRTYISDPEILGIIQNTREPYRERIHTLLSAEQNVSKGIATELEKAMDNSNCHRASNYVMRGWTHFTEKSPNFCSRSDWDKNPLTGSITKIDLVQERFGFPFQGMLLNEDLDTFLHSFAVLGQTGSGEYICFDKNNFSSPQTFAFHSLEEAIEKYIEGYLWHISYGNMMSDRLGDSSFILKGAFSRDSEFCTFFLPPPKTK